MRGRFPPLSGRALRDVRRRRLALRSSVGEIAVEACYGLDAESGKWVSPARVLCGLSPGQKMTPECQERLCFAAAMAGSYEAAAQIARRFGCAADDSTIHGQVKKAGERAREQQEARVRDAAAPALREETVRRAAAQNGADFSLVVMLDGWMARERGEQWGLRPLETKADRAIWREQKTAVVMRVDARAATQSGRRMVVEKTVVCRQGDWDGLARGLHAEALRRGAATAKEVFVVADGGVWIWNLAAERFPHATGVLDFWHAGQHLWAVANALHGEGTKEARTWVEPLLHQLRHGGEAGVLATLSDLEDLLRGLDEGRRETVLRERRYFDAHKERLRYADVEKRGCPAGSGAMESTCAQLQGRFKRTGQFWTSDGKANLMALELARRNGDWDSLWQSHPQQV